MDYCGRPHCLKCYEFEQEIIQVTNAVYPDIKKQIFEAFSDIRKIEPKGAFLRWVQSQPAEAKYYESLIKRCIFVVLPGWNNTAKVISTVILPEMIDGSPLLTSNKEELKKTITTWKFEMRQKRKGV